MQPFPHHYTVSASGQPESPVTLEAENLPELITAPPLAFGGPGDRWSPEELLEKAESSCLVTRSLAAETHLEASVTVQS